MLQKHRTYLPNYQNYFTIHVSRHNVLLRSTESSNELVKKINEIVRSVPVRVHRRGKIPASCPKLKPLKMPKPKLNMSSNKNSIIINTPLNMSGSLLLPRVLQQEPAPTVQPKPVEPQQPQKEQEYGGLGDIPNKACAKFQNIKTPLQLDIAKKGKAMSQAHLLPLFHKISDPIEYHLRDSRKLSSHTQPAGPHVETPTLSLSDPTQNPSVQEEKHKNVYVNSAMFVQDSLKNFKKTKKWMKQKTTTKDSGGPTSPRGQESGQKKDKW